MGRGLPPAPQWGGASGWSPPAPPVGRGLRLVSPLLPSGAGASGWSPPCSPSGVGPQAGLPPAPQWGGASGRSPPVPPAPERGEDQAHPPALHRLHFGGLGLRPVLLLPGTQHLAGESSCDRLTMSPQTGLQTRLWASPCPFTATFTFNPPDTDLPVWGCPRFTAAAAGSQTDK